VVEAEEIILSAGAIGSPQLLLLAGIGPAAQLDALGIQPRVDLAGVGQHVRDHPYVPTLWRASQPLTETFPPLGLHAQLQLRANVPGARHPDSAWITMVGRVADIDDEPAFSICGSLMYAESTGEVRLRTTDPFAAPEIDFRYFSNPADLADLRTIARMTIQIGEHPAFDALRTRHLEPAPDIVDSDAALERLDHAEGEHRPPYFVHCSDGSGQRPDGGCRSDRPGLRRRKSARHRRVDHTRLPKRQHQRHRHDDGRKAGGHPARRRLARQLTAPRPTGGCARAGSHLFSFA
jgi:choline dehydrogenase-like flavoprotein